MADGYVTGYVREFGQVLHTDSAATVVVSLTLPSAVDGVWHLLGRCVSSNASGSTDAIFNARATVNDGTASIGTVYSNLTGGGAPGPDAYLTVSGADVQITVESANTYRSVGMIEAFGVEIDIVAI